MPVIREPLPLPPTPRSVQDARHWVADAVSAMGRDDLVECAELGVSELVTNALLHAEPPLSVRVRGTREHPRVEVADGSPEPPVPPDPETGGLRLDLTLDRDPHDHDHDPALDLSTLGRGLGIVSMCALAWGADIQNEGKVVWFEPVSCDEASAPAGAAVFTQVDDLARTVPEEPHVPVTLPGVPAELYAGFRMHFRELRRELRLLALAHESEYPLAANLGTLLTDFETHLQHADGIEAVSHSGPGGPAGTTDLALRMPESTPQIVGQLLDLLDLADAFCHAERLLSLARTPEQRRFQRWFLGEFVRQAEGMAPSPWSSTGSPVDHSAS